MRRLVTCMEKSQARYEDRQFALWMVAHNLLDRSRADVVELYREKIGRKIEHKLREQVRGEGFELVRRKFPNVRDDELRQIAGRVSVDRLADGGSRSVAR